MKKVYLCILLAIIAGKAFSQNRPVARWQKTPHGSYRCFTDEIDAWRKGPGNSINTRASFENWMKSQVHQLSNQPQANRMTPLIWNIPVIFHIIHNGEAAGTGTNIAAAQVNAQLQQLNNDFRKIMGTSGYNNHPFGADVQIQFCAATVDVNNNALAEAGIERINRNAKGWTAPPFLDTYIESSVKPNSYWDPTKYLNIWVCKLTRAGERF